MPVTAALLILLHAGPAPTPPPRPTGPLAVTADFPSEDTGTMHFASRLTIRWGDAEPLTLGADAGDAEEDAAATIMVPGPSFQLSQDRALLLGWSSTGAGMQEMQALLIERTGSKLSIVDRLDLQSDRPSSALLVRQDPGGLRIGIFRPEKIVFDEDGWFLSCGGASLDMAALRRLPYDPRGRSSSDFLYESMSPPSPMPRDVAWIEIGPRGFRLPAAVKKSRRH